MNRIINGNIVDVLEGNRNAKWKANRRETVICWCNVDWLSGENTGIKSPWHYSKVKSYINLSAHYVDMLGWWDVRDHYIPLPLFRRYYCGSANLADILLSDDYR